MKVWVIGNTNGSVNGVVQHLNKREELGGGGGGEGAMSVLLSEKLFLTCIGFQVYFYPTGPDPPTGHVLD